MIVMDSSIFLAWLFPDEQDTVAVNLIIKVRQGRLQVIVPLIFSLETANSLLSAYRRKRIDHNQFKMNINLIETFPAQIDTYSLDNPTAISCITRYDTDCRLTIYDATYLELAIRRNIPLATLDKELYAAADKVGLVFRT